MLLGSCLENWAVQRAAGHISAEENELERTEMQ